MILLAIGIAVFVVEIPYITMELMASSTIRFNNTTAHCEVYSSDKVR